ncbi:hypothetical protein chiPu_0003620 [Chiloscyllium punctatum]|uniref:Uncharacterized protein n=1 Tax=Chiloscyllium punctatum TaxID=137246 RepID=A0A401S4A9_CHIPU|nr:hypothetical protein [Chiloscyllium punctatum]
MIFVAPSWCWKSLFHYSSCSVYSELQGWQARLAVQADTRMSSDQPESLPETRPALWIFTLGVISAPLWTAGNSLLLPTSCLMRSAWRQLGSAAPWRTEPSDGSPRPATAPHRTRLTFNLQNTSHLRSPWLHIQVSVSLHKLRVWVEMQAA